MEGGRHVQTQAVRKVVREAHEAREEHGREDARPQPQRPRDRRGARQVALDRDQGGGGAPLRHRTALALRRARARGPVGGLPQALRVAEVLQRLLAQEGLRLLEEAQGDTVEGSRGDSARLLTLLHRPSRFQLALPLPDGTCASVLAALSSLRGVLGEDGARRAFGAVLTDNGSEFADEGAIAALLGERDGETRLFYCDPRQSQQKGACEKNHVEIRKLLPKGAGARFDRLTAADCALLMSQVNSEPRGGARVPDAGARAADGPRGGRLRPHGRVRDRGAGARRARPHARLHRKGQGREGRGAAGGIGGGPGHGPEGPLR